jgi:hypothetical protein
MGSYKVKDYDVKGFTLASEPARASNFAKRIFPGRMARGALQTHNLARAYGETRLTKISCRQKMHCSLLDRARKPLGWDAISLSNFL